MGKKKNKSMPPQQELDTSWLDTLDPAAPNKYASGDELAKLYEAALLDEHHKGTLNDATVNRALSELDERGGYCYEPCRITGHITKLHGYVIADNEGGNQSDEAQYGIQTEDVFVEDEVVTSHGYFFQPDEEGVYHIYRIVSSEPQMVARVPYASNHYTEYHYKVPIDGSAYIEPLVTEPNPAVLDYYAPETLQKVEQALKNMPEVSADDEAFCKAVQQLGGVDIPRDSAFAIDPSLQSELSRYVTEKLAINPRSLYELRKNGEVYTCNGEDQLFGKLDITKAMKLHGHVAGVTIANIDESGQRQFCIDMHVPTNGADWQRLIVPINKKTTLRQCNVVIMPE